MKFKKIKSEDLLLKIDTSFKKSTHTIQGFFMDDVKEFDVHPIPVKGDLNDREETKFNNMPMDTIYFFQGKNMLNEFAYLLNKAIENEVWMSTDDQGEKFYRLEYSFTRKGKTSERLRGIVSAEKLLNLCKSLYTHKEQKA